MTFRAALMSLLLLATFAASVLAQPASPPSTGSLTLMSRPAGASFRITGDQSVVGRTPMTLDRGLIGRYHVSAEDIGYERWKRSITLDGYSADTLWMTLKTKNAAMAGLRSLILPGWGQFYDDHPGRGMVFMVLGVAAGAGYVVTDARYRDRVDEFDAAVAADLVAGTPETAAARDRASTRAEDARDLRQDVLIAAGAIWGLSVIEAAISVPHPVGPVMLGGLPAPRVALGGTGVGYAWTVAQVRF
jgi:hypothetical protein